MSKSFICLTFIQIYAIVFFEMRFEVQNLVRKYNMLFLIRYIFAFSVVILCKNCLKSNFSIYLLWGHISAASFLHTNQSIGNLKWPWYNGFCHLIFRAQFWMEDCDKTVRAKSVFVPEFDFNACILTLYRKSFTSIRFNLLCEVPLNTTQQIQLLGSTTDRYPADGISVGWIYISDVEPSSCLCSAAT